MLIAERAYFGKQKMHEINWYQLIRQERKKLGKLYASRVKKRQTGDVFSAPKAL